MNKDLIIRRQQTRGTIQFHIVIVLYTSVYTSVVGATIVPWSYSYQFEWVSWCSGFHWRNEFQQTADWLLFAPWQVCDRINYNDTKRYDFTYGSYTNGILFQDGNSAPNGWSLQIIRDLVEVGSSRFKSWKTKEISWGWWMLRWGGCQGEDFGH